MSDDECDRRDGDAGRQDLLTSSEGLIGVDYLYI